MAKPSKRVMAIMDDSEKQAFKGKPKSKQPVDRKSRRDVRPHAK